MSLRSILLTLLSGLLLALLSTARDGRAWAVYSEIMGCEEGCEIAAAGWPVPYLVDYPGISVAGSADLTGALVGEDHFRWGSFCLTWLFWTFVAAAAAFLWRRLRSPR